MKKTLLNNTLVLLLAGGLTASLSSSAQAMRSYRIGSGLNNQNAAEMSGVKNYDFTFDGLWRDANLIQSNFTINGVPGSSPSSHAGLLPFFRVAHRLNSKWVLGFDYNHPSWTSVGYGLNSFVSGLAVNTRVHTYNLNPRVSYEVNPNVSVGFGLDAYHFSNLEISSQVPAGGPFFSIVQNGQSWGYGFDGGVFVKVRKGTTASLAFFSEIDSTIHGLSRFGSITTQMWANDTLPAAFVLRLTQYVTPTWFVRFTGVWDEQSVAQQFIFQNTARGQVVSPLWNNNSYLLSLLTSYQVNKKWGFLVGASYEDGSQPTQTNRPSFPVASGYAFFGGPNINLSKMASLQVLYGYGWGTSYFNFVSASAGRVRGTSNAAGNVVDFRLSFKA